MAIIWLALMLVLLQSIGAWKDPIIPEPLFYPFGVGVGDTMESFGDDRIYLVPLDVKFPFFNESLTMLYVSLKTIHATIIVIEQYSYAVATKLVVHYRRTLPQ